MKIQTSLFVVLVAASATVFGDGLGGLRTYNLPPAHRLHEPGPGVGGPGPGVLAPVYPSSSHVMIGGGAANSTIQFLFNRPEGMQIRWDVGGIGQFDSEPLVLPGKKNFPQGGIYRLKITNIAAREGVELYPSLEVGPVTPRTAAYLAHNAIPIQFTEEDFDQVLSGNYVTKVIFLPDPEFQEMALAGVETLISTRLDPGVNPIKEADRRGSIMAVVRLGNKDIEMPGEMGSGDIMHASYDRAMPGSMAPGGMVSGGMTPTPMGGSYLGPSGIAPGYASGLTAPQYGIPSVGTPIGLPGPPHIPLGRPAGLQKHVMKNHTRQRIPGPTEKLKIHVRETPGYSYPKPVSRVRIREQRIHPTLPYGQPSADRTHVVH